MARTFYGLLRNSENTLSLNPGTKTLRLNGTVIENTNRFVISENYHFNIPEFILFDNQKYYPTKYEFFNGQDILYTSIEKPIDIFSSLNYGSIFQNASILKCTIDYKTIASWRHGSRYPTQNSVMGMSATSHIKQLINNGILNDSAMLYKWHWCHLIGHRLRNGYNTQIKRNLICGTEAFNGQMLNIERSIIRFILTFKRPLRIEVTCTYLADSKLGLRMKYFIHDFKGSKNTFTEYFDALTHIKSDTAEFSIIYSKMNNEFNQSNFISKQLSIFQEG